MQVQVQVSAGRCTLRWVVEEEPLPCIALARPTHPPAHPPLHLPPPRQERAKYEVFVCSKGKQEYVQLLWHMLDPLSQLFPSTDWDWRLNSTFPDAVPRAVNKTLLAALGCTHPLEQAAPMQLACPVLCLDDCPNVGAGEGWGGAAQCTRLRWPAPRRRGLPCPASASSHAPWEPLRSHRLPASSGACAAAVREPCGRRCRCEGAPLCCAALCCRPTTRSTTAA